VAKREGGMQVQLNQTILESNKKGLYEVASNLGVSLAFMMKHQFHRTPQIVEVLKDSRVYTDSDDNSWLDLYTSDGIVVVDAFDHREGVSMAEASEVKNKGTAIVNFCCCNGKIPLQSDLIAIHSELKGFGYPTISFGGSMMLVEDTLPCEELRVGEALLTGYSSFPYNTPFDGLENPFTIDMEVWSSSANGVVVHHGFLELGGFTDVKAHCINTDFSVFDVEDWTMYEKGSVITVHPDYYTLIRLANRASGLL